MSIFPIRLAAVVVLSALAAAPALAQHDHGGGGAPGAARELPEVFDEPMPLFETALGDHHHPISSKNEKAQAYFDQGFRLMYAFGKQDAVRSFREAWKHDPDCAICYWGEAWAWGSYLNGPMRPFEAPHAYAALQEAVARIGGASPKERAYQPVVKVGHSGDRHDGSAVLHWRAWRWARHVTTGRSSRCGCRRPTCREAGVIRSTSG